MDNISTSSMLAVWPHFTSIVMDFVISHMDISIDDTRYNKENILDRVICERDGSNISVFVKTPDDESHDSFVLFVSASF